MSQRPTQSEINNALWKACDTFRGVVDPDDYKNYILEFMFLKYLSDKWRDTYAQMKEQYGDNEELIARKMSRQPYQLPEGCSFYDLVDNMDQSDLGERINKIVAKIEDENKQKLEGVFNADFNSNKIGDERSKNERLKNLINDFNDPKLDFRPSVIGSVDIIGDSYMYLIERFASGSGKKGGEFFTPHNISVLLAKLMQPKAGSRICDPTCGSGSLLITVADEVKDAEGKKSKDFALYAQESNRNTWALCKMNMFLHNMDDAHTAWGDTIRNPKHIEGDKLKTFDVVVANPPFSLDKWGADSAANDIFNRFTMGVPPKSKGDYAFISHMIASAHHGSGKVGVIVPHGVLFRGSSEGKIRKQLIENNYLEAVIGLPQNLFFGTGIPAAILVFNKGKANTDVLFVDASNEYIGGKNQNELGEEHVQKVVKVYNQFKEGAAINEGEGAVLIDKFAYRATYDDLLENDFNLNIPRYVDTFEEEEPVNIAETQKEIETLENELTDIRSQMSQYLKELNLI
ncbi:type I restriction-modification system subunit M [Aureispira sp. CCB-QB1]|uniref:type I restriction-modification system subunit M n=1 Tax=Aureispira sp. CCB-QB1 TaxID=1313421 RepID=UPI00069632CD|nr:type I restriction-modification system subunit M [Aureispira sp. CCB-QB1]